MKSIIRKGTCNQCGGCCRNPDSGSWKFKNVMDFCQYLRDDSNGVFACMLREKIEAGRTVVELETDYHKGIVQELHNHSCHYNDIFPSPEHFGWFDETPDNVFADGTDALIKYTMNSFNKWKAKVGCIFTFEVSET